MEACFSLIRSLPTGIGTNAKIIKAVEFEAIHTAEALLAAARKEADAIRARADVLAEGAVKKAYAEGMAKARQEAAERLVTARIRANQMIQMAEADLVSLVGLTIEKLFGDIAEERKILGMIQTGLAAMRGDYRVFIRVAPAMEAAVNALLPELTRKLPGIEYFEVLADAQLPADVCILEGDGGVIKCSVSDQLAKLNDVIESALAADDPQ